MIWLVACFSRGHDLAFIDDVEGREDTAAGLDDDVVVVLCADDTGGARVGVAFDTGPAMHVWVEDDRFIDWYLAGNGGHLLFHELLEGPGCDARHDFHPSPTALEWVSEAPTDCLVEDAGDLSWPVEGPWCPSSGWVWELEDRR